MRTVVVVFLALLGMVLTVTSAEAGAWCANYRRGVSNCGYSSYAQCFATVQGLAGYCGAEPLPGNRLWFFGWKLGQSRDTQALSAGVLGERRLAAGLQMGLASPQRRASRQAVIVATIALAGGAVERPCRCRLLVRNLSMGQHKLRLLLLGSVLGHRAGHRWVLPT